MAKSPKNKPLPKSKNDNNKPRKIGDPNLLARNNTLSTTRMGDPIRLEEKRK